MVERDLWAVIKRLERRSEFSRWTRIENAVSAGTPDINACIRGVEFWMELKCPKVHARGSTPVFSSSHRLTPTQLAFCYAQRLALGKVVVLVSNEAYTLLLDGTKLAEDNLASYTYEQLAKLPLTIAAYRFPLAKCWRLVKCDMMSYFADADAASQELLNGL